MTPKGRIYAFGKEELATPFVHAKPDVASPETDEWDQKANDILKMTNTSDGYALVLGIGTGRLAEELIRQSQCNIIAIDSDADKVTRRSNRSVGVTNGQYGVADNWRRTNQI